MPPTSEELNRVQFAVLESELKAQLASAQLLVDTLNRKAEREGRIPTEEEQEFARHILDGPMERAIPIESPKLRLFLNHINKDDWGKFKDLARKLSTEERNPEAIEYIEYFVSLYHQFCSYYEKWVDDWIATLDPDTITALNEAWKTKDDPESIATIQRITEVLTDWRGRELDRIEE